MSVLPTPSSLRPAGAALARLTLVLGGARSGKSRYAESLIGDQQAVYVATAESRDDEMAVRIRAHQERRGRHWTTREAPLDLAAALAEIDRPGRPVLVDCLTLWTSNLMLAGRDVDAERALLLNAVAALAGPVVFVANEVGLGIVPDNALARAFRDHAGRLNQELAAVADRVVFVAAGLPLTLKDNSR
jgi:adenosylcobinamide kinase / adenosylcobinamide-phosphate guanylyltransferase